MQEAEIIRGINTADDNRKLIGSKIDMIRNFHNFSHDAI